MAGISSLQRESHTMVKLAAIKLGAHDDANNPSTLAKIILGATHTCFLTFLRRNLVQVPSSGFILRVVWVRAKLDPHSKRQDLIFSELIGGDILFQRMTSNAYRQMRAR